MSQEEKKKHLRLTVGWNSSRQLPELGNKSHLFTLNMSDEMESLILTFNTGSDLRIPTLHPSKELKCIYHCHWVWYLSCIIWNDWIL